MKNIIIRIITVFFMGLQVPSLSMQGRLPFLLEYTQGFVESLYIRLQDCCKYKDQGIIFIIDRDNTEYNGSEKASFSAFEALGTTLYGSFENGKSSIIVVSKSIAAQVVKVLDGRFGNGLQKTYLGWKLKKIEDFYILTNPVKSFADIDINISKLPDATWDEVRNYKLEPENKTPLTDIFSRIFITTQERFINKSSRSITSWIIYLMGHGAAQYYIAGLPIKEFKKIVDYFDNNITTKFFIYNSCFSGGINKNIAFEKDPSMDLQKRYDELSVEITQMKKESEELLKQAQNTRLPVQKRNSIGDTYNNMIKKIYNKVNEINNVIALLNSQVNISPIEQKNYPFPIVVTSSGEAPTITWFVKGIVSTWSNTPLFDQMFKDLSNDKNQDYYTILSRANIFSSFNSINAANSEILAGNIPQIRLPGLDTFSMDLLKSSQASQDFVVITKTQAQTRDKELKIKESAKSVFVYSAFIPFTLIFPAKFNSSVRVVFMDSSEAYRFKEVNASNMTFEDLCKIFAPLAIKNITLYIDKLIFNEKNSLEKNVFNNVIFEMSPDQSRQLLKFKLSGSGRAFSAETKADAIFNTTISIENIRKGESSDRNFNYAVPEKLKEKPASEYLSTVLSKKLNASKS